METNWDAKRITTTALGAVFAALILYGVWVFWGVAAGRGRRHPGLLEASGRIEGTEYNAASKVAGRVDEVYAGEGDAVQKGQRLALIKSPQLEATIDQAKASARKAKANLRLAESEFQRDSRLWKERAIAGSEFEASETRHELAREDLLCAQKELDKLGADLADTGITAPAAGKVVSLIVRRGEVIGAGTPVATIVDMDELFLKVFLPTESVGRLAIGHEARVFPDSFPGEFFDAVVEKISDRAEFTPKNVDTKSQRAKLVFEAKLKVRANRDHKLKPGMPAEAVIRTDPAVPWPERRGE